MEYLLAVLPSILALGAFVAVMKLIMNADRLERKAEAELDALEAAEAAKNSADSRPAVPSPTNPHMER